MIRNVLILAFFLSGCGSMIATQSNEAPINISSLELTISRSSLYSTDFEHYKLQGTDLFYECGELQRNRFIARSQEFQKADDTLTNLVQIAANNLLATKDTTNTTLPPPGKNAHLGDPGVLTLALASNGRREEFKTNLDDTLSETTELLQHLSEVSRRIRGLTSAPPCNSKVFYGMKQLQ